MEICRGELDPFSDRGLARCEKRGGPITGECCVSGEISFMVATGGATETGTCFLFNEKRCLRDGFSEE